jgi:predicted YcjX-like family ATPase
MGAKRDAELMKLTSRLIERCQNEYYDSEYMDYHDSNYTWIEYKDYPGSKKLNIEVVSEDFDKYFKKYPLQYKRIKSGEINRFDRPFKEKTKQINAMELAYENQIRCRKLVFKIMERHIDGWLD